MAKLELYVRFTDGSGRVLRSEPDTPEGRAAVDRAAFALMAEPKVRYVSVDRVQRSASSSGRGRYR